MAKLKAINWQEKNVEFVLFCPKYKGTIEGAKMLSISIPQKFLHDIEKVSIYGHKMFRMLLAEIYGKTIIK